MASAEFVVDINRTTNHSSAGRWILSQTGRNIFPFMIMILGAAGNAVGAALIPFFTGTAFDAALRDPADLSTIGWAAVFIILSQVTRAFLQFGRNFCSELLGQRVERDSREELYVSLLGKSMTFHGKQPVGDTMARATNDVREMGLMFSPGINLISGSSFFMLMPIIFAPAYHWSLVLAPGLFVFIYILLLFGYMRTLQPIAATARNAFGQMNGRLAEALDGIEIVKGAATEKQEVELFNTNATHYRDALVHQGQVEARFLPLLLWGITNAVGLTHALLLFQNELISVGNIVSYMGLLSLFGFPVFISIFAYSALARGYAGAKRVLELINTKTALDENAAGHAADIKGAVRFENVDFAYIEGKPVLEDVSFEVQPGQTVAIVGQTGSGKSTLARLINRTYDPSGGSVYLDGVDVADWKLDSLRSQISIIEQDIFLFSRTIGENIAFGNQHATQADIIEAAEAAQAHEFIQSLPEGYETVIGERGVTLSGGQRQRLALARAFLAQPHILILDDSTSAVDSATEDRIQQAISLAASRQTTFLITHRLSQIRWADLVIVLRKGRLTAAGKHEQLMEDVPAYRRIFEQYG
ncbi:MAG: ABC transporter ATP-binding protein [Anaerolineae bacterium]